mmetsp:Transcript_27160/g.56046  ORF Transcript_27160/g.56046 Transcript_27160/m.56046 type:complete len:814 (+) Transcript_27160:204-2645(+)
MQSTNSKTLNNMSNSLTSVLRTFRDIEFSLFDHDDGDFGCDHDDYNVVIAPNVNNSTTSTQSFAAIDYGVTTANRATVRTTNRSTDKLFPLGSEYNYPDLTDTTSCSSYGSSSGFSILRGGGGKGGNRSVNIGVGSSTSSDSVNQFLLQQYRAIVTDLECEVQSLQTQLSAKETELRNVELLYSSKQSRHESNAVNDSPEMICSHCGQNPNASQDGGDSIHTVTRDIRSSNFSREERSAMVKELAIKNETIARLEEKLKDFSQKEHHNNPRTESFQNDSSRDHFDTGSGRRSSNLSIASEKSICTFHSFASAPVPSQRKQKMFESASSVHNSKDSNSQSYSLADDGSASGCRIEAILKRLKCNKHQAAGSSNKLQKGKIHPEQSNTSFISSNVSIASTNTNNDIATVKSHGSSRNTSHRNNISRRVSSSLFFDKTIRLDDCKIQRHISHPSPIPLSSSSIKDSLRRKSANSCHCVDNSFSVLLNGDGSNSEGVRASSKINKANWVTSKAKSLHDIDNNSNHETCFDETQLLDRADIYALTYWDESQNKVPPTTINNRKRWNQSLPSSMSSFKTELDLEKMIATTTDMPAPTTATTSATTARRTSERTLSSASDYSKSVGQILNDLISERKKNANKNSKAKQQWQQEKGEENIYRNDDKAVEEDLAFMKNKNGEYTNDRVSSEDEIMTTGVPQQEAAGELNTSKVDNANSNKQSPQTKKTVPSFSINTAHFNSSTMIYQPHGRRPTNRARLDRYSKKAHSFTISEASPSIDRLMPLRGSVDDMSPSLSGNVVFPTSFEDVLEGSMSDLTFRNGK